MGETDIKRVDTKIVYKNRWMTVREDRVRRPNGDHGLFAVVDKPNTCLIVPVVNDQFLLVKPYHYPVESQYWQFPQGLTALGTDTPEEQIAAQDFQSETGLQAQSIEKVGQFHQAYSFATHSLHVFLANIQPEDVTVDQQKGSNQFSTFTAEQIDHKILKGEISDMATMAAWFLVQKRG